MSMHCIQVYRAHMEEGDKYNTERGTTEWWPHECLGDGKLSLKHSQAQTLIHFCPVQESGWKDGWIDGSFEKKIEGKRIDGQRVGGRMDKLNKHS